MRKLDDKNVSTTKIKKNKHPMNADSWQLYVLCFLPMLSTFIFSYLPLYGIVIAFKKYNYADGILGSPWCGFKNFEFFLKSNDFLNTTWNTIYMNVIFIIIGMLSALSLGILLYMLMSRNATKVYQTVLITPHFLSWVMVSYMLYALINSEMGMLTILREKMGFEFVDYYSTPGVWPFILTVANVWKHVGMDSVLYYAALMGISQDLFEAADIDGANAWDKIRYIIIPELKTLIIMLALMKVGSIIAADFGLFYQLPLDIGALYSTTDVLDTYIFRTMRVIGDMGTSSAVGLMQSTVGFLMVITVNAIVKKIEPDSALF